MRKKKDLQSINKFLKRHQFNTFSCYSQQEQNIYTDKITEFKNDLKITL